MKIRLQPPRQEVISDLCNIVHDQLRIYKEEVGVLPEHILFYRDGVSEGQFQQVIQSVPYKWQKFETFIPHF